MGRDRKILTKIVFAFLVIFLATQVSSGKQAQSRFVAEMNDEIDDLMGNVRVAESINRMNSTESRFHSSGSGSKNNDDPVEQLADFSLFNDHKKNR